MELTINLQSKQKHDNIGDRLPIKEFIECCEDRSFTDYDGYASELVVGDVVVYDFYNELGEDLYPSMLPRYKSWLLQLDRKVKDLEIIWCNR